MSALAEGTWPVTIISASAGEELNQSGQPTGVIKARVNVKFEDGPSKGRTGLYEDEINAKSSLYVMRSLTAIGWRGPDLGTVSTDVEAWIKKTGGKSTAEVRHIAIKRGKKFDKWEADGKKGEPPIWDKINSIGSGPRALAAPSKDALADANEAMKRAMADMGGTPPEDEAPAVNDDIPFITSARVSLGEVAL